MRTVLVATTMAVICMGVIYCGWWLKRQINYSWQYESMVVQTIQNQVKPECLRGK